MEAPDLALESNIIYNGIVALPPYYNALYSHKVAVYKYVHAANLVKYIAPCSLPETCWEALNARTDTGPDGRSTEVLFAFGLDTTSGPPYTAISFVRMHVTPMLSATRNDRAWQSHASVTAHRERRLDATPPGSITVFARSWYACTEVDARALMQAVCVCASRRVRSPDGEHVIITYKCVPGTVNYADATAWHGARLPDGDTETVLTNDTTSASHPPAPAHLHDASMATSSPVCWNDSDNGKGGSVSKAVMPARLADTAASSLCTAAPDNDAQPEHCTPTRTPESSATSAPPTRRQRVQSWLRLVYPGVILTRGPADWYEGARKHSIVLEVTAGVVRGSLERLCFAPDARVLHVPAAITLSSAYIDGVITHYTTRYNRHVPEYIAVPDGHEDVSGQQTLIFAGAGCLIRENQECLRACGCTQRGSHWTRAIPGHIRDAKVCSTTASVTMVQVMEPRHDEPIKRDRNSAVASTPCLSPTLTRRTCLSNNVVATATFVTQTTYFKQWPAILALLARVPGTIQDDIFIAAAHRILSHNAGIMCFLHAQTVHEAHASCWSTPSAALPASPLFGYGFLCSRGSHGIMSTFFATSPARSLSFLHAIAIYAYEHGLHTVEDAGQTEQDGLRMDRHRFSSVSGCTGADARCGKPLLTPGFTRIVDVLGRPKFVTSAHGIADDC
jgi:hypothetical protein